MQSDPSTRQSRTGRPGTRSPARLSAVWAVFGAIVSVQFGAAIAKHLFDQVSPTGMAWLRLVSSALVLVVIARPRLRGRTASDWWLGLGYALGLVGMNVAIYESFARIPLGIAVTIEFLGPLAVAVVGSRQPRDFLWVGLAAAGVALLGLRPARLDPWGVAFALLAATGWALYIVLGKKAAAAWPGIQAVTLACVLGALALAAPAIASNGTKLLDPWVLAAGFGIGILSSVIPYSLEIIALRHLPSKLFGILMSLEPAAAALLGAIVLHEWLSWPELAAICCVIAASVGALRSARPTTKAAALIEQG